MTAYAGGTQIQNFLDPNRPDYGEMVLSNAENASALERALMELNADVRGTELIEDARVKAAELGYQGAANLANAGTFATGLTQFGRVAGAATSAYGNLGGFGSGTGVNFHDNTPSVYGTYDPSAPPASTSGWAKPPALPPLPK